MPFEPTKPANNTMASSAEMTGQLTSLKLDIDTKATPTDINNAIAGTALNPSGIGPYGGSFSNPVTQAEMNDYVAYVESLRVSLTRQPGAVSRKSARRVKIA